MSRLAIALLVLLGLHALSQCAPHPQQTHHPRFIRGRPTEGFLKHPPADHKNVRATVQATFPNLVDHFGTSTATYNQYYWYNDQYFQAGGPVYLMVGGEGPEGGSWLDNSDLLWTQSAAANGAFMFVLEHRYYGQSHPTPDLSTSNLVYLSSAQAIEDIAAFIKGMQAQFPQLANSRWVTFGGSYSGALSAWAREKHPELIFAAVGSSGPVQAEVDFVEYMEVVEASLGSSTRGSTACANAVGQGMAAVAQLIQTGDAQTLMNTFNLCTTINTNDATAVQQFWVQVYAPYMEVVQYDKAGTWNIPTDICQFQTDSTLTPLQKMQAVNNNYNTRNGQSGCIGIDHSSYITYMQQTAFGSSVSASRAWFYQTCTEFGFYQSTDSPTAGPFFGGVGTIPANWYTQECTDIFGPQLNSDTVAAAVAQTNQYYGGRAGYSGDHVILPNGNIDPWYALGILQTNAPNVVPVMIDGGSHCSDMYPSSSNDSPSLIAAKAQIQQQLAQWLSS